MTYCSNCDKDITVCYNCRKVIFSQFVCIDLNKYFEGKPFHFCNLDCYEMFKKGLVNPVVVKG